MQQHLDIRVYGKVQGVFFRSMAKQKALEWHLTGYVKNQSDGSLFIEIEGENDALEKFKLWCEQGPPHAVVEEVETSIGPIRGYKSFDVLYL